MPSANRKVRGGGFPRNPVLPPPKLCKRSGGGAVSKPPISYPRFALTGEEKAAILTGDDWSASRTPRWKKAEPGAHRRGRRWLSRAGAALDLRCARRVAHRGHSSHLHARARRCPDALRFCLLARKEFFRIAHFRIRRRPGARAENSFRDERGRTGSRDSRRRSRAAHENSRRGKENR